MYISNILISHQTLKKHVMKFKSGGLFAMDFNGTKKRKCGSSKRTQMSSFRSTWGYLSFYTIVQSGKIEELKRSYQNVSLWIRFQQRSYGMTGHLKLKVDTFRVVRAIQLSNAYIESAKDEGETERCL